MLNSGDEFWCITYVIRLSSNDWLEQTGSVQQEANVSQWTKFQTKRCENVWCIRLALFVCLQSNHIKAVHPGLRGCVVFCIFHWAYPASAISSFWKGFLVLFVGQSQYRKLLPILTQICFEFAFLTELHFPLSVPVNIVILSFFSEVSFARNTAETHSLCLVCK